jgi:hypothetical protein
MKKLILGLILAALPATSALAETVFVGNSFIDAVEGGSQCKSTFQVNDTARVLYRPRGGALGNGGNSYLAYVTSRSSWMMHVAGNDFQASINYGGSGVGSRANLINKTAGITVWEQTPASVTAATPTVAIRGRFANFYGIKDCFVEFRANLVNR